MNLCKVHVFTNSIIQRCIPGLVVHVLFVLVLCLFVFSEISKLQVHVLLFIDAAYALSLLAWYSYDCAPFLYTA